MSQRHSGPSEQDIPSERVEWRAVGYDKPENAWNGDPAYSYDYGDWGSYETAEEEAKELMGSERPYDDVWLERRYVTTSAPQRVEIAGAKP